MFTFEFEVMLEMTLPAQDNALVAKVVAAEAAEAAQAGVCYPRGVRSRLAQYPLTHPPTDPLTHYIERPHHDH